MKYNEVINLALNLAYFDLSMLIQASGEKSANLRVQLHRWIKSGKILHLRRGMYTLGPQYRKEPILPEDLANQLYRPSYLSMEWALSFYGLIPEKVVVYTSVTSRVPRQFKNEFGVFKYSNVKQDYFFGYETKRVQEKNIYLAKPEKALLDLWHLGKGEWDVGRFSTYRFQNLNLISEKRLIDYARKFNSKRMMRAVQNFLKMKIIANEEEKGGVEL